MRKSIRYDQGLRENMKFGKHNTSCIKTMHEELEIPCFQNKSDEPHLAHFLVDVTADSPSSII